MFVSKALSNGRGFCCLTRLGPKRCMGRTESWPENDTSEPRLERRHHLWGRNGGLLSVRQWWARKGLGTADIAGKAIYRRQPFWASPGCTAARICRLTAKPPAEH